MSLSCPSLRPILIVAVEDIPGLFQRDVRWFSPIFFYVPLQERCAIIDSHSFLFTASLRNVSLRITLPNLWPVNQTNKLRLPTVLFTFNIFSEFTRNLISLVLILHIRVLLVSIFSKISQLLKRSVDGILSIFLLHNIYIVLCLLYIIKEILECLLPYRRIDIV